MGRMTSFRFSLGSPCEGRTMVMGRVASFRFSPNSPCQGEDCSGGRATLSRGLLFVGAGEVFPCGRSPPLSRQRVHGIFLSNGRNPDRGPS